MARLRLSGRPEKRGNASRAFGLCLAGEERSLERVCSRVCPTPNMGVGNRPETGRYRCRSRLVAFWSREAQVRSPLTRAGAACVTGDLAREPKQRGNTLCRIAVERSLLQGERPRKGSSNLRGAGVRKGVTTRRATAAKSWDRPGAGRLLPSRKRGPEGKCWVTERWKAVSDRDKPQAFHAQVVEAVLAVADGS